VIICSALAFTSEEVRVVGSEGMRDETREPPFHGVPLLT